MQQAKLVRQASFFYLDKLLLLACGNALHLYSYASWFEMASNLLDDSAPSALVGCLKARAAPTHPRA